MAFSSADWTINYGAETVTNNDSGVGNNLPSQTGDYSKVGPILEFFQWLASEFAANAQMDDQYPIKSDTPTVFAWLNGWAFGHADDYKYLNGGSIESHDANDAWANLYSIGSQESGSLIYLVQDDAEIPILAADRWWIEGNIDILVKVKAGGTWIQSVDTGGTLQNGGIWAYARESDYEYDHNFVQLDGLGRNPVGINNGNDLAFDGAYGEKYLEVTDASDFDAGNYAEDTTAGGTARINYVDTAATPDRIYLTMIDGTFTAANTVQESLTRGGTSTGATEVITTVVDDIDSYTDIIAVHVQRDFTGGTVATGPFVMGEVVNQAGGAVFRFAYIVGTTLYMEDTSGSPTATGLLTGATSGATYTPTATSAQTSALANLNNGAGTKPYNVFVQCATRAVQPVYQYLKVIAKHNAGSTLNGDAGEEYRSANEGTYTDIKKAPYGTFAGGTFFGARGVWIENYAVASFALTDANNDPQNPPDYQKAVATHTDLDGSVSTLGGVQLFVSEITGDGGTYVTPYTFDQVGSTATTIRVNESIDINKVPQSGTVRFSDDSEYTYTGLDTILDEFTGTTDATGESNGASISVPLITLLADADTEQSDNIIYSAAFWCRIVARRLGTKPYSVDQQFGANGLNFSPILADDPQAT